MTIEVWNCEVENWDLDIVLDNIERMDDLNQLLRRLTQEIFETNNNAETSTRLSRFNFKLSKLSDKMSQRLWKKRVDLSEESIDELLEYHQDLSRYHGLLKLGIRASCRAFELAKETPENFKLFKEDYIKDLGEEYRQGLIEDSIENSEWYLMVFGISLEEAKRDIETYWLEWFTNRIKGITFEDISK